MASAKVVSLNARPWKVSQLCFEIGGVLDQLGTQLGADVTPFDFKTFYAGLNATAAGDPSLLSFNSQGILGAASVVASTLAALRAEPRKAALDSAIASRQNAFFAKYGNVPSIVSQANNFYGVGATAKPARLQNLSTLSQQQADQLAGAYTSDGRTGVVKNTNSVLNSKTTTTDSSSSSGESTLQGQNIASTTATGQMDTDSIVGLDSLGGSLTQPPPGGAVRGVEIGVSEPTQSSWQASTSGEVSNESGASLQTQTGDQVSSGNAYAVESQTIVNTDYGYRVPSIESQAQNERAQISLIDQQFAQFMASQNLPNLATVLQNELNTIDLNVYRQQVGFLSTILLSPIGGTVTGIYKNPGDCVAAGEPILRVEDNSTVFLLATLIFRGPIKIGSTVTVTTALFDDSGAPTTVSGTAIAVRSRGDDDQWDLVVQCTNPLDASGSPILPIGYHFDYDNTNVSIT